MPARAPEPLEYLEGCRQGRFDGSVNRVVWADRSPTQGSNRARGRWNGPDCQFEVLNTSLSAGGADAEFEAFWSLFEQRPDRRALNWKLRVRLLRVVELGFEDFRKLGVGPTAYRTRDYSRTQEISEAVNDVGCDGLIAPSARYDCNNLIIYLQNMSRDCVLEEVDSREFLWSE